MTAAGWPEAPQYVEILTQPPFFNPVLAGLSYWHSIFTISGELNFLNTIKFFEI
jgi:hypothetical protein